jgi:DNA topoisomerase-1
VDAARAAGLRYSTDETPGIHRKRAGRGFTYVDQHGRRVRGRATLARIRQLAIPPAWRDVWICGDPRGHLQATGRDARGRKVYRYHPEFRERREAAKFDQLIDFGRVLPRIRRRVARDLRRPGVPREKVLAAAVRMLELTLMRVGNEEYARLNSSFGLTTLRSRHARVTGSSVRFRFRGKSGKWHTVTVRDRRLARIVARWQDLPGQELFQYVDGEGEPESIDSGDVNQYLRDASGTDVTSKLFRTWAATLLAMRELGSSDGDPHGGRARGREAALAKGARRPRVRGSSPTLTPGGRHEIVRAMEQVADRLGNTPAVVRGSYVHPAVVEAFASGELGGSRPAPIEAPPTREEEAALLRMLRAARNRERRERKGGGARRGRADPNRKPRTKKPGP